jgi:hypothetical protein
VFTVCRAESLQVEEITYQNVVIRSVSPTHVIISHDDGISQIALADLPDAWKAQLEYDPAAAARHQARIQAQSRQRIKEEQDAENEANADPTGYTKLRPKVDFRVGQPSAIVRAKDQGRRPVNAIYATVGALEFAHALSGNPIPLSEEYVLWATLEIYPTLDLDQGIHFAEIAKAIQINGVCREPLLPNKIGRPVNEVEAPSIEALNDASRRRNLQTALILAKGDPAVAQILINLNQDRPVVAAMRWPHYNTFRQNATLRAQQPMKDSLHVVTLVGYQSDPSHPGSVLLVFRNSFGPRWGVGGYGYVASEYLKQHFLGGFAVSLY